MELDVAGADAGEAAASQLLRETNIRAMLDDRCVCVCVWGGATARLVLSARARASACCGGAFCLPPQLLTVTSPNIITHSLEVTRQPLMAKYLRVTEAGQQLRAAFRSPHPGAPPVSDVRAVHS